MTRIRFARVLSAFTLAVALPVLAQEKSVRPGINDPFKDPDVKKYVETFEGESREVFAKRTEIVAAVGLKPGAVVADVGAGTGLFTRLFAAEVKDAGTVYAVDIAQKFLDHITKVNKGQGIKNVKTVLCKEDSAELPADGVEVVFVCDTYHHFEFPQRTLASIHKALKTKGKLVVVDFKKIPGESSAFVLGHVRAGQDVVEKEIAEAGFKKVGEEKKLLKENYFVVFEKAEK